MVDKSEKVIKLVEVADTWQGEGPDTGRQMLIARFKHCNLHCSYCDTWIKMKTTTEGSYSIEDINIALQKTKGLMLTGGEPTLETDSVHNLTSTLKMIKYCNYQALNVETNGCNIETLLEKIEYPKNSSVKIMYSPKVFNEKMYKTEFEKIKKVINHPLVYIKIVADKTQLVDKFIREISKLTDDKNKIYLMPMGTTNEEIESNWVYTINLADECNINISTRMHIVHSFT
jgi:organic radical activating enzyme